MKLSELEKAALREAADQLDRVWDFDESRGYVDQRPGVEYDRRSVAPILRRIAERKED